MEHQRVFGRVGFFPLEEGNGMFAPVAQRVEVVRGVVAVVVAVAVGLLSISHVPAEEKKGRDGKG